MNRLKDFSVNNPTGDTPGMEPVRTDILKAAVENTAPADAVQESPASRARPAPLVAKNIRLPADIVDFVDYDYTKTLRIKKQDAYTAAIEAFFRPLMTKARQGGE
jgi:hypothetical protein